MNRPFLVLAIFLSFTMHCSDPKANAAPEAKNKTPMPAAGKLPVDLSELRDSEKTSFERLVDRLPSACGKAHSLRVSIQTDSSCKRSIFAARYLVRLLKEHLLESEVEEHYEARFSSEPPAKFDLVNAPSKGKPHSPVILVEFSDFQCPHCKHLQPILQQILDAYPDRVQLFFKNYPIKSAHPDAALAAAAALAAGKQGKFWNFHDRLYGGDQSQMDMATLEKVARDLKLDLKKWRADIESMNQQVEKDHAEGERVNISATPTLFVNGRKFHGPYSVEEVKDWIEEELNR